MHHDVDGWWMLWGGLMMLFFWGGIIALAIWLVRSLIGREEGPRDTAMDVARRRYAAGEITRQEFEQIRHDLSNGAMSGSGPPA